MLIASDSIPHKQEILDKPWCKQIDTSRFIAKALYEIHTSDSVSRIHQPACVQEFDLRVD